MAKRIRGTGRPGQRPAIRKAVPRPPAGEVGRASRSLTQDEEARAVELEAQILARERAAEAANRRSRERAQVIEGVAVPRGREAEPLSVRAAHEYAYVRRDVIRIVRIAALLLSILAILYVLINVMRVVQI